MAKNDDSSNKGKGIGFTGLLQIVFITLKLLDKITWSWVWVLAPAWIYASIHLLAVGYVVVNVWKIRKKGVVVWQKLFLISKSGSS